MDSYPQSHMTLWSHDVAWSRERLKPLYLHYHSVYGHQIWWDGNLPLGALNHKAVQRSNHVVLQGHVIKKIIISLLLGYLRSQNLAGWALSYLDELRPKKSHDSVMTWCCEITKQTKTIICLLPHCLWSPNLVVWWHTLRGSYPFIKSYKALITWSCKVTWQRKTFIYLLPKYL